MRHSAISHALAQGANPIALAQQTGHDKRVLLSTYAHAIDLNPKDNSNLAISLFELGIHKQDGTALDFSSMSRIKYVVSRLKTAPESTLPLFPAND